MKTKYALMRSEPYQTKKHMRMTKLKNARKQRDIQNTRDYFAVANAIAGKDRIDSRVRVIIKKMERENGKIG